MESKKAILSTLTLKQKIITISVFSILFFFLIALIRKAIRKNKGNKQQLDGFDYNVNNLSYAQDWYKQAANSIYAALNRNIGYIDEDTVFTIFTELQNEDDYKALVKAFGIRSETVSALYYAFGKPQFLGNLLNWIQEQFWTSEVEKVRKILQKINVVSF